MFRTLATVPERYGYVTIRDTTGQSYLVPYSSGEVDEDSEYLVKIVGGLTAKEYNRSRTILEEELKLKLKLNIKLYLAEPIHRQLD
jgi:hypothetical protein